MGRDAKAKKERENGVVKTASGIQNGTEIAPKRGDARGGAKSHSKNKTQFQESNKKEKRENDKKATTKKRGKIKFSKGKEKMMKMMKKT